MTIQTSIKNLVLLAAQAFAVSAFAETQPLAMRFIYAQGFGSCSVQYDLPIAQFKAVVDGFQASNPTVKLASSYDYYCFDLGMYGHSNDPVEHLYLAHENGAVAERVFNRVAVTDAVDLAVKSLEDEAAALKANGFAMPMQVYIAGHSHGGWLLMQLAAKLVDHPNLRIERLLTLDPISYKGCPSNHFLYNATWSTFWFKTLPKACLEAPSDLLPLVPSILKSTGTNWSHFYQSSMPYLRSGPIPGAPLNYEIPWIRTVDYWTGHMSLLRDSRVWRPFYVRVFANLVRHSEGKTYPLSLLDDADIGDEL